MVLGCAGTDPDRPPRSTPSTSASATADTGDTTPGTITTTPVAPAPIAPRTAGDVTLFPDVALAIAGDVFFTEDVAVTDDGGVCVAATTRTAYTDANPLGLVIRVGPDGQLAADHGDHGVVQFDMQGVTAAAAGPDSGCFIGTGVADASSPRRVELLDRTGALDPRFAPWPDADGADGNTSVRDLAALADGGVLVLWGGDHPRVTRLLPDGAPDPGFGDAGTASPEIGLDDADGCRNGCRVAALADGRVLVSYTEGAAFALLDPSGIPDPTYGDAGVTASSRSTLPSARWSAVAADGSAWLAYPAYSEILLEGFDAGGSPPEYAAPISSPLPSGILYPTDLEIDSFGRPIGSGHLSLVGGVAGVLYRTDTAGAVDPTFGDAGFIQFSGPPDEGDVTGFALAGNDVAVGVWIETVGGAPVVKIFSR